jgi:diguanylate cyclase (GGDEF)-like protein
MAWLWKYAGALAMMGGFAAGVCSGTAAAGETALTLQSRLAQISDLARAQPRMALPQLDQLAASAAANGPVTQSRIASQRSYAHLRLHELDAALKEATAITALGRLEHNDDIVARGLLAEAYVRFAMDAGDEAHRLVFMAEQLTSRSSDLPLRVQVLIAAGQSYAEMDQPQSALQRISNAVALARTVDDSVTLISAFNALARQQSTLGMTMEGLATVDEMLAYPGLALFPMRKKMAYDTEYALAQEAGLTERALGALQRVLALERALGLRVDMAITLSNLSDMYISQHAYRRAYRAGLAAVAATRAAGLPDAEQLAARNNLALAAIGVGKVSEGKAMFKQTLASHAPRRRVSLLMEYARVLERVGDHLAAVQAFVQAQGEYDALLRHDDQQMQAAADARLQAEKKQHQIDLLNHEKLAYAAEAESQRRLHHLWWALAAVSLMTAVVIAWLYRRLRASSVQLALRNRELAIQSTCDPLTALYNRRHFQEFMGESRRSLRPETGDVLLLLDVDHFKRINDTYGHAAGDAVLKQVAAQLRVILRGADMIVRWGGEEFLAWLPSTSMADAAEVAQRVLDGIAAHGVRYQGHTIHVSASLGYAALPTLLDGVAMEWERTVNLIDMALYLAKSGGRNRAVGVLAPQGFSQAAIEAAETDLARAADAGHLGLITILGGVPQDRASKAA